MFKIAKTMFLPNSSFRRWKRQNRQALNELCLVEKRLSHAHNRIQEEKKNPPHRVSSIQLKLLHFWVGFVVSAVVSVVTVPLVLSFKRVSE